MAANSTCSNFTQGPIRCDFIHILLMEANGDLSPLDIPALASLMKLCMSGDIAGIQNVAHISNRSRAAGAARFILRKHQHEIDYENNLLEQAQQTKARASAKSSANLRIVRGA